MDNDKRQKTRAEALAAVRRFAEQSASMTITGPESFRQKWAFAGREKLPGLLVPIEYGGHGLDAVGICLALEELGNYHTDAGFNFALAAHLLACVVPIVRHGNEAQRPTWLPNICTGSYLMANAMTEAEAGSAAYQMTSSATLVSESGHYRLNGHKTYCSNAPAADLFLTYALTNAEKGSFGGVSAFVIPRNTSGLLVGDTIAKAGLQSCLLGEIKMDKLDVEPDKLLGLEGGGARIFQESMDWERICLGAVHLGEMNRLLKNAVTFTNRRKPGGVAIGKHQSVAHPLARLKARMAAGRALMLDAAASLDAGESVAKEAAMVKLIISETYRDFAQQLHQLYGGAAFHAGHPAAECLANAAAATVYSGTSEIQCNIIARYLGIR